jgi:hypothetical protein
MTPVEWTCANRTIVARVRGERLARGDRLRAGQGANQLTTFLPDTTTDKTAIKERIGRGGRRGRGRGRGREGATVSPSLSSGTEVINIQYRRQRKGGRFQTPTLHSARGQQPRLNTKEVEQYLGHLLLFPSSFSSSSSSPPRGVPSLCGFPLLSSCRRIEDAPEWPPTSSVAAHPRLPRHPHRMTDKRPPTGRRPPPTSAPSGPTQPPLLVRPPVSRPLTLPPSPNAAL